MEKESDAIRCGIIGLGRWGWGHHAQEILKHPRFTLAAVCDVDRQRIRKAQDAGASAGYTAYGKLLDDPGVELVVITSQSKDHERHALHALQAGKHVLVEKPACRTAAGLDRLCAAAKQSGTVLTTYHKFRLHPDFLLLREVLQRGVLGPLFRISRREAFFARRNDWQTLRKYGGGQLGNWAVHLIDGALQLGGSPVKFVWGSAQRVVNPGDAEDDVKAILQLESGLVIDIEVTSASQVPGPTWSILGRYGSLWIQNDALHLKYFNPARIKMFESIDARQAPPYFRLSPEDDPIPWVEETLPVKPQGTYPGFYDNLFEAIRRGAPLLVSPESTRETYAALDRIRRLSGL